jgi:hypothetical protein
MFLPHHEILGLPRIFRKTRRDPGVSNHGNKLAITITKLLKLNKLNLSHESLSGVFLSKIIFKFILNCNAN